MNIRGMTLLEIVVSVSIVVVMASLVYGSARRQMEARELAMRLEERYSMVRITLSRITREISMAFLSNHVSPDKRTQTIFKGVNESPINRLTFSSFSHQRLRADVHESDQNIITYYGKPDKVNSSLMNIMRYEKSLIDDKPEEYGEGEVLARGVVGLRFRYYDEEKKEWVDSWDTMGIERGNKLPRYVEVSLTILDEGGKEVSFVSKAKIQIQKPLSF
ncbi:MAG: type II secretion system protein GspJ [Deltaproteobacteria bacterium]|nr:type II secretion system protein GspJ [Deltaproteobacteria bacterium]